MAKTKPKARSKPKPKRITVAEELANRDCRYGLAGVMVEFEGYPYFAEGSYWAEQGKLRVRLGDGLEAAPEDLVLLSNWAPVCCEPKRRHALNKDAAVIEAARRLREAAPDLLDACRHALARLEQLVAGDDDPDVEIVRAAIRKAEVDR